MTAIDVLLTISGCSFFLWIFAAGFIVWIFRDKTNE